VAAFLKGLGTQRLRPSPVKFGYYLDRATGRTGGPLYYEGERHMLLFGLNGVGKSTRILVENLLTLKDRSLVIFDVKGELAAQTARARRKFGEVKIINPYGVVGLPSDGFNPLARLEPGPLFYDDAAAIGDAMIEIEGTQPHWSESAQGLLVALIMWEVITAKQERRAPSLFNVRQMLTEADQYEDYTAPDGKTRQRLVKGLTLTATQMVEQGGEVIASLAGRFVREHGKGELSGIQSTASTQTEWLLSQPMRDDLEKPNGANLAQLRDRPTTVYVILPASEISRKRRWTRVVISAALREHFRPGAVRTLFILDEFYAALGHLKIIEDVWSLVRGYGIQLMPVVQSATQLKALYKDTWENFWGQAGAVATIGPPGDPTTANFMAEKSGKTTVVQEGWNSGDSTNMQGASMSEGVSYQQIERPFLLPQELMDMPVGTGRIWTPGKGTTSIPFFAPNFWKRKELRGLYDPNPYYQDATKADKPKTKGTAAMLGAAGIIGALAFIFGAHTPGGPAPAKAGDAPHVMAAPVVVHHRPAIHAQHRANLSRRTPDLIRGKAEPHPRHHTQHHPKRRN
jgi:type IV secretion system protein VirD4